MRSATLRPVAVRLLVALLTLGAPPWSGAQAQVPASLNGAMSLYASAAYDDALAMLERLPSEGVDATTRVSIDHYRMLCLLALGRTDEAERVIASLLDLHPTYRIAEGDASPRVMKVFAEARQKALPRVIIGRYAEAKRRYEARDHAGAASAFALVRALLADPDIAAIDPQLADLAQVATGFEDLSRAAMAADERRAAEAAAAADAAATARAAQAAEAARLAALPPPPPPPPAEPADGVYAVTDAGVMPPVVLRQDLRRWMGPLPPPPTGTPLGQVELLIDETGAVRSATVVGSISGFYDAILVNAARDWKFRPATRAGQPVKFRRVVSVLAP